MNPWIILLVVVLLLTLITVGIVTRSNYTNGESNISRHIIGVWAIGLTLLGLGGLPWLYVATTIECYDNYRQFVEIPFITEVGSSLPEIEVLLNLPTANFQSNMDSQNPIHNTLLALCTKNTINGLDLMFQVPIIGIGLRIMILMMVISGLLSTFLMVAIIRPIAITMLLCSIMALFLWFGYLTSIDTLGITDMPRLRLVSVIANLRPGMGIWVSGVALLLLLVNGILILINGEQNLYQSPKIDKDLDSYTISEPQDVW